MKTDITIVIPSIPPRSMYLARAVHSAAAQEIRPAAYSVAVDLLRQGAGPTRTRAMRAATTTWVAFLDDDDELMAHHTGTLLALAEETDADVLWPWFKVVGGTDPMPENQGKQWDPAEPHTFPITSLVRTEVAQAAYFPEPLVGERNSGEDWSFWMQLSEAGAKFAHTPEVTWWWHHDSGNTSGRPERWGIDGSS